MGLYLVLMRAQISAQAQYRASFALQVIGFTLLLVHGAERETVTSSERATIDSANAADNMCRAASEYRRHVDTAIDGDIRSRTRSPCAEPQDATALHAVWRIDRYRFIVDGGLETRQLRSYRRERLRR